MPQFLCRLLLCVALAGALPAAAAAQTPDSAKRFVADLSSEAIRTLTGSGIPKAQRRETFRHLFVEAADLPSVGKRVLGHYWRSAPPEQRDRFLKLFEDIVVYTWATRFENAAGSVRLQITQAIPAPGGMDVDSVILREHQDPVPVVWRLRPEGNSWKIIDLAVSGTSMTLTYHDEYNSVLAANNGSVAALNDALARKVAQLSAAP